MACAKNKTQEAAMVQMTDMQASNTPWTGSSRRILARDRRSVS
jgi:hypothetical protein